jgi:hypothetical protein
MSNLPHRFIVTSFILILAACSHRSRSVTAAQQRALGEAGQRLNLPVRTSHAAYGQAGGASVLTAAALNLEQIPATELRNGIDLGVAYIDAPSTPLPRDYYRVRATADIDGVGQTTGRVAFLDAQGRTAGVAPAAVDVWSMTLPPESRTQLTQVAVQRENGDRCPSGIWTCYKCPNGQTVCYCAQRITSPDVR